MSVDICRQTRDRKIENEMLHAGRRKVLREACVRSTPTGTVAVFTNLCCQKKDHQLCSKCWPRQAVVQSTITTCLVLMVFPDIIILVNRLGVDSTPDLTCQDMAIVYGFCQQDQHAKVAVGASFAASISPVSNHRRPIGQLHNWSLPPLILEVTLKKRNMTCNSRICQGNSYPLDLEGDYR